MPFLSMYLKHCGWDPQEIGMLLSIRPIVSMLSAPIWGGLADRTGKKKAILTFIFAMSCVCRLSIRFTHGSYVTLAISLLSMSVFYSATMVSALNHSGCGRALWNVELIINCNSSLFITTTITITTF